ncbi:hypothetical protein QWM81_07905 [Streptomyces ficellus]|uniref:Uncharacterized protein n=1 Tax=Streptomyces ficellus TaxID=1977088 RepID=A0ABT7Z3D6_9ACTN|nr:hypothetical protein [Streptomyces ficellus]MDN3293971.1 hypothetical protein [Streptomyces ficellus]
MICSGVPSPGTWQFWLVHLPATPVRRGKRPHVGIAVKFPPEKPL